MNRLIRRYATASLVLLTVFLLWTWAKRGGTLEALTEEGKCPACYGTSLCGDAEAGRLRLGSAASFPASLLSATLLPATLLSGALLNIRNVYRGVWTVQDAFRGDRDVPVVLKKLAHDGELRELDRRSVCV